MLMTWIKERGKMKFANIIYSQRKDGLTIGDDMQLLGIENLYKYMNINYNDVIRIEFSKLQKYKGPTVILPISFPLLNYNNDNLITCFSPKIVPVFWGFCILADTYSDDDVKYLKKYEPTGCRDQYTYKNMIKHGISAYINTCMTIGLPTSVTPQMLENRTKIFCIDGNGKLKSYIPDE